MDRNIIRKAFYTSLPVMAGYIVLGIGFGILMNNAGYGAVWTFAMSVFIYAGSMQYVGVGLLAGGAAVLTTALTTFMVNARHLFYSISMIGRYKDTGTYKPYLIFALTDETYSLLCSDEGREIPEDALNRFRFFVSLFDHVYWVTGSVLGSLAGAVIPSSRNAVLHCGLMAADDLAFRDCFVNLLGIQSVYAVAKTRPCGGNRV